MKRIALILISASGLLLAQDQRPAPPQPNPPATTGGWRRVGETPPPQPLAQAQDPEPVDRSDAYGQPMQNPQTPPPARDFAPPPADRPAYGLPPEVTLQPGTYVTVRINQMLSSDRNQPGDSFSGTLIQPVVVDGLVVAQRGQTVYGHVAEAQRAHSGSSSRLGLELTNLTLVDGTQANIRTQLIGRQGATAPVGEQVGTVAGTTAIGAVVGAAADWGRGAAIGATVGAAAGVVGVMLTRNRPTVVYPETALTFRIDSPLLINTTRAPAAFRYVEPDEYDRPTEPQLRPRPGPPAPAYYGPAPYPFYYPPYPYYRPGISLYIGPRYGYRGYVYRGVPYRRWR